MSMMAEAGVHHLRTANRSQVGSIVRNATSITAIVLEDGTSLEARVYIDGTYEGDLMARSGASYTWGRESRDRYNESFAGRRDPYARMDWAPVSPYADDGSLLWPLVTEELAAPAGAGDDKVQGYNFRLCVTDNTSNAVPFPKPQGYNRSDWRLLFKYASVAQEKGPTLASYLNNFGKLPGEKYDLNNGGLLSTDCTGCSWGYVCAGVPAVAPPVELRSWARSLSSGPGVSLRSCAGPCQCPSPKTLVVDVFQDLPTAHMRRPTLGIPTQRMRIDVRCTVDMSRTSRAICGPWRTMKRSHCPCARHLAGVGNRRTRVSPMLASMSTELFKCRWNSCSLTGLLHAVQIRPLQG